MRDPNVCFCGKIFSKFSVLPLLIFLSLDEAVVIRDHNIVLFRLKNFSFNYCQYPTYLEL